MSKNIRSKKGKHDNVDAWTEEQYEEYLKGIYGADFIAGFTENGLPYGTFIDEDKVNDETIIRDALFVSHEELPF